MYMYIYKTAILITFQNNFFAKLILISSLARAAFLSIYQNLILILFLVKTALLILFYYA